MYVVKEIKTSELKIGIKVKSILREDGKHIIVGEILNISLDDHPYQETLVKLNVSGGDVNDDQVHLMIRDNVNVTVPATDVLGFFLIFLFNIFSKANKFDCLKTIFLEVQVLQNLKYFYWPRIFARYMILVWKERMWQVL